MAKVAFIGVSAAEKNFFEENLGGDNYELQFLKDEDWLKIDRETEVLSVFVDFNVTHDVLDVLPNLKMVTCRSTGFNNVDPDITKARSIIVANTPGYGATSVAEYVFGLILNLSRKFGVVLEMTGDKEVDRLKERGFDLSGRTIGIVGLGAIGRGVAKIATGFGMKIIGYDPFWNDEFARANNIAKVELDDLCREADIVTLHVPYSLENHHLISAKRLEMMKSTALIINTSRGELLNTLQLARLLDRKKLAGAGLDVIEDESYLMNPNDLINLAINGDEKSIDQLKHALAMLRLERMPNVIITNHNAYNTGEALYLINDMTVQNIMNFATGNRDKIFVAK